MDQSLSLIKQTISNTILKSKKNSPHVLFVGGVLGVCASTFLACRATLRFEETINDIKVDIKNVKSSKDSLFSEDITYSKDLMLVYSDSVKKLFVLYGPSFVLGCVSIGAITGSHVQLSKRNTGLTAAYAGLSQILNNYRERIRAEVGEEREQKIYIEANEVYLNDKENLENFKSSKRSNTYVRLFDKNCSEWKPSSEYCRFFLMAQQQYANDRLNTLGYVFLNDIYDWLGFDRTPEGQLIGWVINNPNGSGYISFGLDNNVFDIDSFTDDPNAWILDFNVEGIVYDMIG